MITALTFSKIIFSWTIRCLNIIFLWYRMVSVTRYDDAHKDTITEEHLIQDTCYAGMQGANTSGKHAWVFSIVKPAAWEQCFNGAEGFCSESQIDHTNSKLMLSKVLLN